MPVYTQRVEGKLHYSKTTDCRPDRSTPIPPVYDRGQWEAWHSYCTDDGPQKREYDSEN